MRIHTRPLTQELALSYPYDGTPVQMCDCPHCGQPAWVVNRYLGGYGHHVAYRCTSNPHDHHGPLFWDKQAHAFIPACYEHYKLQYSIVPSVIIAPKPQPETILP